MPLPWRDKLNIFGSYSRVLPLLGPDLGLIGISGQASLRYVMTLPSLPLARLWRSLPALTEDLQFGYDFKSSNNNLSFGGLAVSDVTTEVDQFSLTYDAGLSGDYGQTSLTNMLVFSPGNLTSGNTDALFQQQAESPLARARYLYDTFTLVQLTRLPYDASWMMKLTAQVSDTNLLPSEQLGAGGHDTVRGYDERAANGSDGIILSEELRSPPFSLAAGHLPKSLADQAQLLAFWDFASVREAQHTTGAPPGVQLSSVGLGARYTLGRFVDFRFDYGWQLDRLPGATRLGHLAHFALTTSY